MAKDNDRVIKLLVDAEDMIFKARLNLYEAFKEIDKVKNNEVKLR
ncbi:MAG: hypothetical protein PHQ60_16270 [Sideroxydans sp.]|nr:hypothetical protein [Sideroxydans sp.]